MAIYLYQRKQCRILTPSWLSTDYLQGDPKKHTPRCAFYASGTHCLNWIWRERDVGASPGAYEEERSEPNKFFPLPDHYLEVAHILLIDARGCFTARDHMEVGPGPLFPCYLGILPCLPCATRGYTYGRHRT